MPEPLKNMYNQHYISTLADAVKTVHKSFKNRAFESSVFDDEWGSRELKARTRHVAECLHEYLPSGYKAQVAILREAARSPLLEQFDYENMIFPDFVEVYGLNNWETSVAALEQFTQQTSGEFAVRPFILQDTDLMMAQMLNWAQHENHHVRRLASEGCRPRLPWAMSLPSFKKDPAPILPILHTLKHDPSEYVRRSVANNLNDIAKDNPHTVLDVLRQWQETPTAEIQWMKRHALRTLAKNGDPEALALLGYGKADVSVQDFAIQPQTVNMGDEIEFSFSLTANGKQSLMIDYVMHFVRTNGKSNAKVFKLTTKDVNAGETLHLSKRHSFKPISTRRYYPGTHTIEIQVNGKVVASKAFELVSVID